MVSAPPVFLDQSPTLAGDISQYKKSSKFYVKAEKINFLKLILVQIFGLFSIFLVFFLRTYDFELKEREFALLVRGIEFSTHVWARYKN